MYKNLLILPDGTELHSGVGTTNAIKNVKLTSLVNSGDELIIGSPCCAMIEASLFTPGGNLALTSGDEIILYKESSSGERIRVGTFCIEAPTRPTANTMKLVGYDRVSKLDKDLTEWLKGLDGWPYSVNGFASLVCAACGLTFVEADGLPNGDFTINEWSKNGITGRQIMRWLGEIVCRFVCATPEGAIRFEWYADSGKAYAPSGSNYYFAGSLSYENYQVTPVNAVQLRLADSDAGALWPQVEDGANAYVIPGNPILLSSVTEDLLPYLEVIQAELESVTYTPCEVSVPADPTLKAGDIVTITDANGKRLTAYVMTKTSSGQRDTITCTGSFRRDSSSAAYNKTESEKKAEAEAKQNQKLSQDAVFNALTNNGEAQGVYIKDGQLYINASYLGTGFISSADGKISIDLTGNSETPIFNTGISTNGLIVRGDAVGATKLFEVQARDYNGSFFVDLYLYSVTGEMLGRFTETFSDSQQTGAVFELFNHDDSRRVALYAEKNRAGVWVHNGEKYVGSFLADSQGDSVLTTDKLKAGTKLLYDSLPSVDELEENQIILVKMPTATTEETTDG